MSIVSLADGPVSTVTIDDLNNVAAACGFDIKDEEEQKDYLLLLQSGDAVVQAIDDGPDYIPPQMLPVETSTERSYWRPEAADNPLSAWSHRCEISAKNPQSSLLQGRTVALKDNICVGGLPTTIGTFAEILSKDGKYPISPIEATVVRRLLEAGAIVKGTAVCENYSLAPLSYSSASGPVHSPWLRGYNVGGSTSGPAALVAANGPAKDKGSFGETVNIGIGTDQGGSVRLPSSLSGIYGLKQTHGLVPYSGFATLGALIDHPGPMANSVMEIAIVLKVIAGYDGLDPRMTAEAPLRDQVPDYPKLVEDFIGQDKQQRKSLRIGILSEGFTLPAMTDTVRDIVRKAANDVFKAAGAEVADVSVPMHSLGAAIWTAATRQSLCNLALQCQPPGLLNFAVPHVKPQWPMDQRMYDLLSPTNPAVVNAALAGQHLSGKFGPHAEAKAHRKCFELRAAYDKALEEFDVLVTPTTTRVAPPHPKMKFTDGGKGSSVMEKLTLSIGSSTNTCPFNVTGHPAINVPCGFAAPEENGADAKLPVGMQLIAKRWDETTLLQTAALFEAQYAASQ